MRGGPSFKAALVALAAAALGCEARDRFPPPPPPPPCEAGVGCGSASGTHVDGTGSGGGGGSGSGGGGGATGQIIDVTGTVGLAVTAELDQIQSYDGLATIEGPGPKGTTVKASFGGAAGKTFTLVGVVSGSDWLFVHDDTSGATGVLSTFSPHTLPSPTPITVPVVDQTLLQGIAQNQPGAPFLDETRAQIILVLKQGGVMPASGVSVKSGAGGAILVYDQGPGIYTGQTTETGSAGVIVLLNAPAAQELTIELGLGTKFYDVVIPTAAGAATVGRFDLE